MIPRKKGKRRSGAGALANPQEAAARSPGQGSRLRDKIATVVLAAALVSLAAVPTWFRLSGWGEQPRGPSAAIADQLSLMFPDPGFVQAATSTLQRAGYGVDYYPGEEVTVDFYRHLPAHHYELIVLRVHSGVGVQTGYVGLFTSEPYSPARYLEEERTPRFNRATYYPGGPVYFGIAPGFVQSSMRGRFGGTTIILMGCDGLKSTTMAEAFVNKGAKTYVGWDGPVSATHTDAATERLLQHLLVDRLSVGQAVAQTMAEVGPDPAYGSSLVFYPPESVASAPAEGHTAP